MGYVGKSVVAGGFKLSPLAIQGLNATDCSHLDAEHKRVRKLHVKLPGNTFLKISEPRLCMGLTIYKRTRSQ